MATVKEDGARYLYVGIFTDEKVLQFTQLLESLSDQCFQELHQIAAQKVGLRSMPSEMPTSSPYGLAFLTGLGAIQNWNSVILQQQVDELKLKWPYLDDLFRYTVVRYLQEVYSREKPQTIKINVPPLRDFVHQFYIQVANNPLTRNLKYFSTFGMEKKNMIIDAIRSALFHILEHQIDYNTSLQIPQSLSFTRPIQEPYRTVPPSPPQRGSSFWGQQSDAPPQQTNEPTLDEMVKRLTQQPLQRTSSHYHLEKEDEEEETHPPPQKKLPPRPKPRKTFVDEKKAVLPPIKTLVGEKKEGPIKTPQSEKKEGSIKTPVSEKKEGPIKTPQSEKNLLPPIKIPTSSGKKNVKTIEMDESQSPKEKEEELEEPRMFEDEENDAR